MTRSIRLYPTAQFEEVKTLVDQLAERSDLPPAERDRLTAFQADLHRQSAKTAAAPPARPASPRQRADLHHDN